MLSGLPRHGFADIEFAVEVPEFHKQEPVEKAVSIEEAVAALILKFAGS